MKKFMIMILMCFIPSISLANNIDIVTRYSATSSAGVFLINIANELNNIQTNYNFRINSVPGADGEAADQKALELGRLNSNVVLFSPSSSFTFNRLLVGNTYDRDNDFIKIFAVSSAPIAIQVNPTSKINNISDLIEILKQKEVSYFSSTITSGSIMMFNRIFLQKYNLNTVKNLKYRTPYDISRSVLIGESDYTIFNLSDITMKPILISSDSRLEEFPDVPTGKEIGFDDFNFTTLNMFSVPKEKKDIIPIILPLIENSCNNDKIQEIIKKSKYTPVCSGNNLIEEKIKKELILIEKYKNFIEIRR